MKTIAITIDEVTLRLLDEVAARSAGRRARSALVRAAIREFVARQRQQEIESSDGAVLRKYKLQLARQARALVAEQARP